MQKLVHGTSLCEEFLLSKHALLPLPALPKEAHFTKGCRGVENLPRSARRPRHRHERVLLWCLRRSSEPGRGRIVEKMFRWLRFPIRKYLCGRDETVSRLLHDVLLVLLVPIHPGRPRSIRRGQLHAEGGKNPPVECTPLGHRSFLALLHRPVARHGAKRPSGCATPRPIISSWAVNTSPATVVLPRFLTPNRREASIAAVRRPSLRRIEWRVPLWPTTLAVTLGKSKRGTAIALGRRPGARGTVFVTACEGRPAYRHGLTHRRFRRGDRIHRRAPHAATDAKDVPWRTRAGAGRRCRWGHPNRRRLAIETAGEQNVFLFPLQGREQTGWSAPGPKRRRGDWPLPLHIWRDTLSAFPGSTSRCPHEPPELASRSPLYQTPLGQPRPSAGRRMRAVSFRFHILIQGRRASRRLATSPAYVVGPGCLPTALHQRTVHRRSKERRHQGPHRSENQIQPRGRLVCL
mmetsp:Transcript_6538/g.18518  ORF Transcript_6538/g.18518 Transcript_6538/m.18518 type:complete len:462 (-) Transcript_6538:140-1525(-)